MIANLVFEISAVITAVSFTLIISGLNVKFVGFISGIVIWTSCVISLLSSFRGCPIIVPNY